MRVVVVDDQEIERFHMKVLFKHCPDVHVVGESDRVEDAAELINREQPDAVFLDIDLGKGTSGFDVLPLLETNAKIVFVTLYNEYAVRAFRVNALDYIMKPVTLERLSETLVRISRGIQQEPVPVEQPMQKHDYVHLKEGARQALVPVDQIAAIAADGDYTKIFTTESGVFYMRRTMKEWMGLLPNDVFSCLDRTLIVSCLCLQEIREASPREAELLLRGIKPVFTLGKTALKEARRLMKLNGM